MLLRIHQPNGAGVHVLGAGVLVFGAGVHVLGACLLVFGACVFVLGACVLTVMIVAMFSDDTAWVLVVEVVEVSDGSRCAWLHYGHELNVTLLIIPRHTAGGSDRGSDRGPGRGPDRGPGRNMFPSSSQR